ncbi:MAG: acyl-CoA/acyl-ACP dehydrogenase [Halieaceae bacterium]|jgi:alkylation response protein AidB-like acyl-CoA dehydrogenase|nr:acyl-CoA/acyl-ACP dehydrogenase [Halieaceae bacterium]
MIIDLSPTEDQAMIRTSVADLLDSVLPLDRLLKDHNHLASAELSSWSSFADQGLFGLAIDTESGGTGYSIAEQVVVCNEFGRHLVSPITMATMLATQLAVRAGLTDVVRSLIGGDKRAAFANPVANIDYNAGGTAEVQVIDGTGADYIILIDEERALLFNGNACEFLRSVPAIDETINIDRLGLPLDQTLVHSKDDLSTCRHHTLMLAAYLLGMAEVTRNMAVDYARIREQFGQPIGKFQAVKHICADMAVRAEAALAQTFYAATLASVDHPNGDSEAASARLIASRAALDNARANIQVHGGMGFSAECTAHFFLKRAHIITALNAAPLAAQSKILADLEPLS